MSSQGPERNIPGYVQLISAYFDLRTDEAVVEAQRDEIQRYNDGIPELYRRYFIPYWIYPVEIPKPEEVLAKWDPNGSKRSLRNKLEHIQTDQARLSSLMDVVDESMMKWAPRVAAVRIEEPSGITPQ